MFGRNEIVGQKYFEGNHYGQIMVTSVFLTLQGEGPFTGRPAVFIRLTKCNLACSFCDTYFETGEQMFVDSLWDRCAELMRQKFAKNMWSKRVGVVFTGGEPSLQREAVELFLSKYGHQFMFQQIETNGILSWAGLSPSVKLVVSPKASEKGGVEGHHIRPHVLNLSRADCLKFVLSANPTSAYYTIPAWAFAWRDGLSPTVSEPRPVYVSPMNVYRQPEDKAQDVGLFDDVIGAHQLSFEERVRNERVSFWTPDLLDLEQVQRNHEYAAQYAIDNGLWLSIQAHLFASIP